MIYVVYRATNKINGKIYIGKSRNINSRKSEHLYSSLKNCNNNYFHNAIKKYGIDGFLWEIIYETSNEELAYSMEKEFISKIDSKFLYNVKGGGEGQRLSSNFNSKNISKSRIDYYSKTENKEKFRKQVKEYFANCKNKIAFKKIMKEAMGSDEIRGKISKAAKIRWSSEQNRQSERNRKIKLYKEKPEIKEKISKSRLKLFADNPSKKRLCGLNFSKAHAKKRKKVIDNFTGKIYASIKEASEDTLLSK